MSVLPGDFNNSACQYIVLYIFINYVPELSVVELVVLLVIELVAGLEVVCDDVVVV